MRFSPSFLDELRSRISLVDLIGRRVALKRAGREWKGLCPFHREKTPSFHVVEDKGFYHCFGCGAHGDAIRWLEETEGLSFTEAVGELAARAGMPLPRPSPSADEEARASARARLFELLERAARQFARMLAAREGARARAYLERRGVARATVADFRLGYAPDGEAAARLIAELAQAGYREDELVAAGLVVRPEEGSGRILPRFRDRVMFPITDPRGRVVGFGGRTLGDHPAKYLNSPDGPLFHKGRLLYNYAGARRAARDGNLIVVEGYMDVLALVEAGFAAAVAPLGTAVSEEQLALAWKLAPEPVFCFDGDAAGRAAADRVIARALPLLAGGRSLRFVLLPEGEDPDSLLRREGAAAFRRLLEGAVPLVDMLWEIEIGSADLSTPERRRRAEESLMRRIEAIADRRLAALYRDTYWRRLRPPAAPRGHRRERRIPQQPATSALKRTAIVRGRMVEHERLGARLLALALDRPALMEAEAEEIAFLRLGNDWLDRLRDAMLEALHLEPGLDPGRLDAHLRRRGLGSALEALQRQVAEDPKLKNRPQDEDSARRSWLNAKLGVRKYVLLQEKKGLERKVALEEDSGVSRRLKAIEAELEQINLALAEERDRD